MIAAAGSRTPPWSPQSRTRGKSGSTAPTYSSGLCLSRQYAFRCGTRSGPRANSNGHKTEVPMFFQRIGVLVWVALLALILGAPHDARAFCGFYVGKADEPLVNHASQVVIAHHDDKTVISLMNDYQGEPSDFALVVPVPVVLQKGQVHIGDRDLFQKIDAYSSPRLVENYDPDPCQLMQPMAMGAAMSRSFAEDKVAVKNETKALGVTVEAEYTVGEYDIGILSAKESTGLQ